MKFAKVSTTGLDGVLLLVGALLAEITHGFMKNFLGSTFFVPAGGCFGGYTKSPGLYLAIGGCSGKKPLRQKAKYSKSEAEPNAKCLHIFKRSQR